MDERIRELLNYFREYVLDTEGSSAGLLGTAKATYPMLVVSLGKQTGESSGPALKRQLLNMWPAYKECLLFLEAEKEGGHPQFSLMESGQALTDREVQEKVSALFEENIYFQNYNRLLVFYLLDTCADAEETDLSGYLDLIRSCGQVFSFPWQNNVLFLTVNERIGNEKQAARIRNEFAELYFRTEKAKEIVPCTYLVSNKNTTGSTMPKKDSYFERIFTDIILLCNGPDSYVSGNMLYGALRTVGYTTQEKPVDDIAKVSVSGLLKKISDLKDNRGPDDSLFLKQREEDILHRLGIRKDGSFFLLEPYLASASRYFPTREEIDAFPRRTCEDLDLFSLSVSEAEEETFGAWGCYISSIVSRVEQEIVSGLRQEESFRDIYLKHLQAEFTRGELIWMSKNPEEIRRILEREYHTAGGGNVIDSLKEELAARIFENAGIRDLILDTIVKAGQQADEFMHMWKDMVNTESIIIRQGDIVPFYDQKVQQYIDRNGERIAKEFQSISDMEELKEFLFGEIRSLIKSDPVFRAPFEKELIERANQKDPAQALKSIADHLWGNSVKVWLASNGASLDDPVQMSLLMQDGTDLYRQLHETLPDEKYYYYDTDRNDSADALNIYVLNETQVVV